MGALFVRRKNLGRFIDSTFDPRRTFAAQSVLAKGRFEPIRGYRLPT
jgi:hypothetical protein